MILFRVCRASRLARCVSGIASDIDGELARVVDVERDRALDLVDNVEFLHYVDLRRRVVLDDYVCVVRFICEKSSEGNSIVDLRRRNMVS